MNGVTLYGVARLPRADGVSLVREATVLRFRELGALVQPAPYARVEGTPGEVESYRRIIDAAFLSGAILPAPFGTVFRSAERVRRWLEQNYIALSEGLHFVAGRCEARVHISERPAMQPGKREGDVATIATECFRLLRRSAVAAVPVRHDDAREVLSGAFLISHDQWREFAEQVNEQAQRYEALLFEQTGPWPPYDFVRMDFGE
jgi:hypothetical protein